MKPEKNAAATEQLPDEHYCWETFFAGQKCPVLRSQLITALMAGTQLEVSKLPSKILLDVVLIATASREFYDAEIVDDYQGLLERAEEVWRSPGFTSNVMWSIHAAWANSIINRGTRTFDEHTVKYIPEMVGWYLAQTPPEYISEELKEAA